MNITVVTEPMVYLVGKPFVDWDAMYHFLKDSDCPDWNTDTRNPGEVLIEVAGRNCYQSFQHPRPGGNEAYIRHLLEVGHGSVLEHCVFSFILTGVSRSFTHQLIRHRVGFSYSELSQRFVDNSDVAFVVPPLYRGLAADDPLLIAWRDLCAASLHVYRHLDRGAAGLAATARRKALREAARSVLPECTETKIFVTANVRALRHFLELRGDPGADAEIRSVAVALAVVLKDAAPHCFADVTIAGDPPRVTVEHRKV